MERFPLFVFLLITGFLVACREEQVTAEVEIHQLQPQELYQTYLPDPVGLNPVGLLLSDQVVQKVAAAHDYRSRWKLNEDEVIKKLRSSVKGEFDEKKGVLKISASGSSPEIARQIANSFATEFHDHIQQADDENRKSILASLDALHLKESDLLQDLNRDRTVIVQQYGVGSLGEPEDASPESEGVRFLLARNRLSDLELRKDLLTKRQKRYSKAAPDQPSELELAVVEAINEELEQIERLIDELTKVRFRSEAAPVEEVMQRLTFQQADLALSNQQEIVNRIQKEQQRPRFLLKVPFDPVTIRKRAR